ncbi:macrophage migration inhibitory factor-like protein [Strigomonas culicis]|uniref:L-dopachrome isomerase n=1 Tax=Strigomonas culicis TaxID=28005 RepID=S9V2M9_9TRYP|nr:macrophage migration inhibitory factor-like protein [Strigomonas culicis]EPY35218.1 macrophage migration inhibitory factor-like protein [Strigomonas culicis]|eukprot:EPY23717.1 macrophage migration inhibitory factor-like protein [Strigomonas culicis]
MPLFETKVSAKLDDASKASLYNGYKKVCSEVIGKPDQFLMVTFEDGADMFFQDTRDPCAYVNVKLFGKLSSAVANKATAEITALITKFCSVPSGRIYVSFFGTEQWGWSGRNF